MVLFGYCKLIVQVRSKHDRLYYNLTGLSPENLVTIVWIWQILDSRQIEIIV
jgi:hypothetical protein